MISRSAVARYVADQLPDRRQSALQLAAAWLVRSGRRRETAYLACDITSVMSGRGYLAASVTTARPLTNESRPVIEDYLKRTVNVSTLELSERVDPTLIGGLRLELPGAQLDASVRRRLDQLPNGDQ